jgi:hypothetical protein
MNVKNRWNDNWQQKLKYLEKKKLHCCFAHHKFHSSDLGLKLDHCNRKPATKSLNYMAWPF